MKVLKLKTANTKRSLWVDCGIHAREWIAISTCVYFINKVFLFQIHLKQISKFIYLKITQEYNSGEQVARDILNHYE